MLYFFYWLWRLEILWRLILTSRHKQRNRNNEGCSRCCVLCFLSQVKAICLTPSWWPNRWSVDDLNLCTLPILTGRFCENFDTLCLVVFVLWQLRGSHLEGGLNVYTVVLYGVYMTATTRSMPSVTTCKHTHSSGDLKPYISVENSKSIFFTITISINNSIGGGKVITGFRVGVCRQLNQLFNNGTRVTNLLGDAPAH